MSGPLAENAAQLLALLEQLVLDPKGPQRWEGTSRSHESVAGERIFEFRVGRLRAHWFYGEGKQIAILAVGALKSSRTTSKALARELKRHKLQYESDVAAGQIYYVPE